MKLVGPLAVFDWFAMPVMCHIGVLLPVLHLCFDNATVTVQSLYHLHSQPSSSKLVDEFVKHTLMTVARILIE